MTGAGTGVPILREFGTDLLRTAVAGGPRDYQWVRRTGSHAPEPFVPTRPDVDAALINLTGAARPGLVRAVLGTGTAGVRRYRVRGSNSVAGELLGSSPNDGTRARLYGLGALLSRIHAIDTGSLGRFMAPRPVTRLATWMDGIESEATSRASSQLARTVLHRQLSQSAWDELRRACSFATGDRIVLVHGASGLGSLVAEPDRGAALLCGEDLALAPAQYDIGWVLGECVELAWQLDWKRADLRGLVDSMLSGYGADLDDNWHQWVALRVAIHLHDLSSYVPETARAVPAYAALIGTVLERQMP